MILKKNQKGKRKAKPRIRVKQRKKSVIENKMAKGKRDDRR